MWGTVDAEIKVSSFGNPDLSKISSVVHVACQNIALRALPTARNSIYLISHRLLGSFNFISPLPISFEPYIDA